MSPNTERLSLTAAVLVATLAWPCLEETTAALADGAGRIALFPAAWSRSLAPAGAAAGCRGARRTAARPPAAAPPRCGNREFHRKLEVLNITA